MESQEIAVVQQCYQEFGNGNVAGVLALLSDQVDWIDPGYPDIPYAGKRKGKSGVGEFFGEMSKHVEFARFEPKSFHPDQGNVFVTGFFSGKAKATGKTFTSEWAMLWKVEDGKVAYYQAYIDTANVAKAINP